MDVAAQLSPAARRKAEHRERQRLGLLVVPLEIYRREVEQLIAGGWLAESDRDSRPAIAAALGAVFDHEFGENGKRPFPSKPS